MSDPRIAAVASMLTEVPTGYYAVRGDELEPLRFVRITLPRTGRWVGYRKIATQHGDEYLAAAVQRPNGTLVPIRSEIVDLLILIIADPEEAALAYALEIGACCRCSKTLTDERSRWYGIGPECEKINPRIIARVDEIKDGSYEYHNSGVI